MALGSTQPLTGMNTRCISWGQRRPVRKADNLTTSCAVVMKSGNVKFLEPSGPLQACDGIALSVYLFGNSKFMSCCTRFMTHVSGKQSGRIRVISRPYLQIATVIIGSIGTRCTWAMMFTWRSIQKKGSVSWYRNVLPSSVHIRFVFLNVRTLCVLV
jgi:hypothetical protein